MTGSEGRDAGNGAGRAGGEPPPEPRAFCVGQAKAGTTSVHGLLATGYRAAHEPERGELLRMVLREADGDVTRADFASFLRARQERLGVEFDIAWQNQFVIGHLVEVFPGSRFIVLFREPRSWLASVVGHLLTRELPPVIHDFLDWWFRPEDYPHTEHDAGLRDHGLYSARAFLAAWRRHVRSCVDEIPAPRRLILRTHEIPGAHRALADFLDIPVDTLDVSRNHLNRNSWDGVLDDLVDPAWVREVVTTECEPERTRYFPEHRTLGEAPSARHVVHDPVDPR